MTLWNTQCAAVAQCIRLFGESLQYQLHSLPWPEAAREKNVCGVSERANIQNYKNIFLTTSWLQSDVEIQEPLKMKGLNILSVIIVLAHKLVNVVKTFQRTVSVIFLLCLSVRLLMLISSSLLAIWQIV